MTYTFRLALFVSFLSLFSATCVSATLNETENAVLAKATKNKDQGYDLWPAAVYDESIPTHKQVLGYNVGERITNHGDMLRFFEALERAAPERIKVFEYGRSWEGRKLIYAAIGKPEYIKELAKFSENMLALSDPRVTSKKQAQDLISTLPSSVWLEHSVHGNEISGTDSAMMTAYHLLAAPNDPVNKKILSNTIVFIDPLQNPDGRTRFTSRYYATVGISHSADRLSAEQNEPWPRGRSNHYLFDMNRDWLAITQPETAGRIKILNQYRPLVVVDIHEMGGDNTYFFAPVAEPVNPLLTKDQLDNMEKVGRNNANYFDQFGFDYFTREVYDAFYPGYGDSWPTYYGAAASTYEVSSSRGMIFRRKGGDEFTFKDTVHRHFVASISTAEVASDNREKLLNDYYQYQVNAIAKGKKNKKERVYIMPNERDRAGTHRLATLMAEHGVEVKQATSSFKACGVNYKAGAYFIDTAQPRGLFVTTTFTKQVDMADDFIKEQERRRARKLNDQIYDVTAWSLPLMFNIESNSCGKALKVSSRAVSATERLASNVLTGEAAVAYIVPWGDMAAARFLTLALQKGISIKSADKAFEVDGKHSFPAGSLIIEKRTNGDDIASAIKAIANTTGAIVQGVDTSWVTKGPSFGGHDVVTMSAPNVAIAWDKPVSSLSAGNARFVIEQQFNYPVTAIRSDKLKSANLSHYHVIILPSGNYQSALGKSGGKNLKRWVKNGGVLITLNRATRFASDPDIGLLDVSRELAVKEHEDATDSDDKIPAKVPGQIISSKQALIDMSDSHSSSPDYVAGILANVEVDQEHWLTAGVNPNVVGMVVGSDIYTPMKLNSGKNVAWFANEGNVLASGYLWKSHQKQLAYKPFLMHQPLGKGMVIGFTQDPTTRAYLDGLNLMLMNSIFRAAAHASPLR